MPVSGLSRLDLLWNTNFNQPPPVNYKNVARNSCSGWWIEIFGIHEASCLGAWPRYSVASFVALLLGGVPLTWAITGVVSPSLK